MLARHQERRGTGSHACKDVIALLKTRKSTRTIAVPRFLIDEFQHFPTARPSIASGNRPLPVTKHCLKLEMNRSGKASDSKGMRIYDLHHSHVS